MNILAPRSSLLETTLSLCPPKLLFHYTSSHGIVGILKNREMWASNSDHMNDSSEHRFAAELARNSISILGMQGFFEKNERLLFDDMINSVGSAAMRFYLISFSENRDLLSQWRAYCPPHGGYSIGFSSDQLAAMARKQNFVLVKCVYDQGVHANVISEIVKSFVSSYRDQISLGKDEKEMRSAIAWEFAQHLAYFGAMIKHPAFSEECEWRLISQQVPDDHPRIDYRGSDRGVIPYYRFALSDEEHTDLKRSGEDFLTVIVGPTPNMDRSANSIQFLLKKFLDGAGHGVSNAPYRTW
jgi:hypothetical protein